MRNVFITGIFRSGTSLLWTSLNVHKNIIIGWQPFWLFFKACRNKFFKEVIKRPFDEDYPMGIIQFRSEHEAALFRDVFNLVKFDSTALSAVISEIKAYLCDDEGKINKDMKPHGLESYIDDLEPGTAGYILSQLIERLYLTERNRHGSNKKSVNIVGIKEVFCEEYIKPILNYRTLDTVVLHIIRDPRGIIASRNYGKYFEATGSKYPIFFIIKTWLRSVSNYYLNNNNDNYLMIRYEDLVTKPDETLREICNLLGVGFSEDLLDCSRYTDGKGNRWQPNSSFHSSLMISTLPINKWMDVLSTEEVALIEYFCQSELRRMGYEITTEHFDVERILAFQEDKTWVRNWLRKYEFRY